MDLTQLDTTLLALAPGGGALSAWGGGDGRLGNDSLLTRYAAGQSWRRDYLLYSSLLLE